MADQSIFTRFPQLRDIPTEKFPKHLFIIPDGNGRWARARHLPVTSGHQKGFAVANAIMHELRDLSEIKIITMWGFSADNWKRNDAEVHALMLIFKKAIETILGTDRRFIHIGRKDRLPDQLKKFIQQAEEKTAQNQGQILCLAIDFGGEDQEIRLLEKARQLSTDMPITKETLWQLRDGGGLITPADLLIRTSGEKRTSDVGWLNSTPTELYFTDKYFPDMQTADVVAALVDFSKRERRFGGRK